MRLHLPLARPLLLLPWDPSKEGWQGQGAEWVAGSSGRVGSRLPASTLGQRKGRHPAQSLCTLQPGDPAAETRTQPDPDPEEG